MTHPSRAEFIPYLKEKLGDVPISVDEGFGIWENTKRAWLMYHPEAEYHCVVQDDMIIGKDFRKNAEKVLRKDRIYNFYIGKAKRIRPEIAEALKNNTPYLIKDRILHECCFAMRTDRIKDMITWCEANNPTSDRIITQYVLARKLTVYFPLPSLVDHRDLPSLHSLYRGSYENGAMHFIGE